MSAKSMPGVVVCREAQAAPVGGQILKQGGNAVDAAIASALAQGVVNPMMTGLGGTAQMSVYWARSKEFLNIQGLGGAGERARPDTFEYVGETPRAGRWAVKDHANYIGHKASVIPTFVRVMGEAHRLFGRLPWGDLFGPSIDLAANGFAVSKQLADRWDLHAKNETDWPSGCETLSATEACATIYMKDGRFYQPGEILVQKDYGHSLEWIAAEGPSVFYEGEMGQIIADDFETRGLLTRKDLLRCRAVVSRPLEGSYRDYTLHGTGPIRLLMYNILEGLDVSNLGHNTPRYLDTLARAFQMAHVDRARYSADPNFEDVPTRMLTSKEYAARLCAAIQSGQDLEGVEPGIIPSFSTTSVVTMDEQGNAAAITHSNGNSSGVVTPGLGFLYNNHMHNFNPRPGYRNWITPGKSPVGAAGGPLIVGCADQPFLVIAHYARGGTTSEVQVVLNMIEFGMNVRDAVSVPRIHGEYLRRTIMVDEEFPAELIAEIEALGTQKVVVTPNIIPAMAAVHREPSSGRLSGGSDPRGEPGLAVVS